MLNDNFDSYLLDKEEPPNYWMSYSDMMSGLLLIFVLFLSISIFQFNEQSKLLTEQSEEIKIQQEKIDSIIGVRTQLIEALKKQFKDSNLEIDIDSQTGAIRFSSGVFFDINKYTLKPSGKAYLSKFIPLYINVLLNKENSKYISEIIIEGHTDTNGTYMYNLDLSQKRAFEVTKYILSDEFKEITNEEKNRLRKIITANGRSFSNPIKNKEGRVDLDKSRRVEFKFRLKDEEMIQEMNRLLKGNK